MRVLLFRAKHGVLVHETLCLLDELGNRWMSRWSPFSATEPGPDSPAVRTRGYRLARKSAESGYFSTNAISFLCKKTRIASLARGLWVLK